MRIILSFCLLAFLCNQVAGQPSYKIWSVMSNHNINLGDTVIFDVGLSGYGYINPKFLKFSLYGEPTVKMFYTKYYESQNTFPIKQTIGPYEILVISEFSNLLSYLFKSDDYSSSSILLPTDNTRITIESHICTVPSNPGDKNIKIIATYSADSLSWYTEEAYLSFHVNTYYEEHQTLFNLIGLFLAFLALIKPKIFGSIFNRIYQLIKKNNSHMCCLTSGSS